jgi:hypothetical protein
MPNFEITSAQRREVENLLHDVQAETQTPETIGPILLHAVLSQAATKGTFIDERTIEVPMSVTIKLPTSQLNVASVDCTESCWRVFGADVLCFRICQSRQM